MQAVVWETEAINCAMVADQRQTGWGGVQEHVPDPELTTLR